MAMKDLVLYKPQVDAKVGNLHAGLLEIQGKVDQLFSNKLDPAPEHPQLRAYRFIEAGDHPSGCALHEGGF